MHCRFCASPENPPSFPAEPYGRQSQFKKDLVDTQTRHALKSDPLVQATASGANWLQNNREKAIRLTLIALAVIVVVVIAVVVYSFRSAAAENAFGTAMDTFNTPIAVASQPAPPGTKTFASAAERAKAANPLFLDVTNRYGMTSAGHNALYFAGLTYEDMNQTAQAETYLKKAVSAGNANIASLSKLALANLYTQTSRTPEAIKLLQDLAAHPTAAVPSGTSQLTLASIYKTTDPAKAHEIYATLKEKDKTTAAGEIASQALEGK
jgi:tetratricopeptide (TPR) repeat protein